jgi:hypothetical protein
MSISLQFKYLAWTGTSSLIVPGRDPLWTESTAVGDLEWIESLAHSHVIGRMEVVGMKEESPAFALGVRESYASYGLKISEKFRNDFAFSKYHKLQRPHCQYGVFLAGTLLAIIPPAVLFFSLQKEFVAGLTEGGVKG